MADDPAALAQANPSLGYLIALEHVRRERSAMPWDQYLAHRLGVGDWPDISDEPGRVISRELFASCAEHDQARRITSSRAYSVDVNPDRTWGSVAVAGQREDLLWQFAVADRRRRTDWIRARCVELNQDAPGSFAVLARGPAANLIGELEAAGLSVKVVDGADYAVACSDFFDAFDRRDVRYPFPQQDLDDALGGARKNSQQENAWTWSRKASTSADISPLVAGTLALWAARNAESQFTTVIFPGRGSPEEQASADPADVARRHFAGIEGAPRIITLEEQTACFRCATGSYCPVHHPEEAPA